MGNRRIEDLGFTVRTYNVLKRSGINFEDEIRKMDFEGITSLKNIHFRSVDEIEEKLGIEFDLRRDDIDD